MKDKFFLLKLTVFLGILSLGFTLIFHNSILGKILGTVLVGIMYSHAVELQHQCLHHTAFKNKRINRIVGFFLGLPMLVSFSQYQKTHLHHHAHLGRETDREFFDYKTSERLEILNVLIDIFGVRRLLKLFGNISKSVNPVQIKDELEGRIGTEYRLFALFILSGIIFSYLFNSSLILELWLIPLVLVSEPTHFLIELPEHLFCNKKSPDVYQNTRTIEGSLFSFWLTNGNNFHVEHHKRPSVPISDLPSMYTATPKIQYRNFELNYPGFYLKAFQSMLRRSTPQADPVFCFETKKENYP